MGRVKKSLIYYYLGQIMYEGVEIAHGLIT